MIEGTSQSLGAAVLSGLPGNGIHTGYMTSLGNNSPKFVSPLLSTNQSQLQIRHNRVQSNTAGDSFNNRVASQSALGLVSNLGGTAGKGAVMNTRLSTKAKKTMTTMPSAQHTQQQQIQEKIRQLQAKDLSMGACSGVQKLNTTERNVLSVLSQMGRKEQSMF